VGQKPWIAPIVIIGLVGTIVAALTTARDVAASPRPVDLPVRTAPVNARQLADPLPPGVVLQPIDGGANFYTGHGYTKAAALDSPNFFPIGIWYPSLNTESDVATYEALGINMLDRPDGACKLSLLTGTGIYAIPQYGECGGATGSGIGKESVGLFTDDEVDMNYGPGAGYTYLADLINRVPSSLKSGRFFWTNYGTGVLFWEPAAQAAQFVNGYQQTVSDDLYWFTTPSATESCAHFYLVHCTGGEARRGSNYGSAIDAIRAFEHPAGSEPIWAFVENGWPFTHERRAITPADMNWAIWSSIIHGARGIIYFNHSFSGPAQSDNNFENSHFTSTGITGQAKATDSLIRSLAPVLNDDTAVNYVTARPAPSAFGGIESMAKYHDAQFYIFADTRDAGRKSRNVHATFHLSGSSAVSVTVVNENRTIQVVKGTFTDTFATGTTVHIYAVNG